MRFIRELTEEERIQITMRLEGLGSLEDQEKEKDESKAFDCIACGKRFVPAKDQWIFHNLCGICFLEFDQQKMAGRMGEIGWGPKQECWFYNAKEWVENNKTLQ